MTKQDVVNNGWMTDVAIASDDKITLNSDLFKAHITHPDVYGALYGDEAAATTVNEPEVVNEVVDEPEVVNEPEVINEPEVVNEVVDEPEVVNEIKDEDPVEPEA